MPATLYNHYLLIRVTDKKFEMERSFLKMITNKNYTVDLAKFSDKKLTFEIAKEMVFDEKASGIKSSGGKTLKKLPSSPAVMAGSLLKKISQYQQNQKQNFYLPIRMKFVIDENCHYKKYKLQLFLT